MDYRQMSDDEITDVIAKRLGWITSDMGHGFYSKKEMDSPFLFGPTHITQHFFEACQSFGVDGGRYHLRKGRWVHQLLKGNDSSVAEHECFLRAGCIALADLLDISQSRVEDKIAV